MLQEQHFSFVLFSLFFLYWRLRGFRFFRTFVFWEVRNLPQHNTPFVYVIELRIFFAFDQKVWFLHYPEPEPAVFQVKWGSII